MFSDIRELIQVDDVMEDESLRFGPNGGLVFCMEYFTTNFDWLEESLGHVEDDYILFDCPGKGLNREEGSLRVKLYVLQSSAHWGPRK